jgi:hypothetical protein
MTLTTNSNEAACTKTQRHRATFLLRRRYDHNT